MQQNLVEKAVKEFGNVAIKEELSCNK